MARVFDDLSDELCRVADMSEFVRLAHPDADFAAAAEDACITVSGLVEQLNTHVGLYEVCTYSLRKCVLNLTMVPRLTRKTKYSLGRQLVLKVL